MALPFSDQDDMRDTLRSPPRGHSSLRPPPLPSSVAPYEVPARETSRATVVLAGVMGCLYVGFELEHHWQLGGWLGVAYLVSVALAAAFAGAAVVILWGWS